MICDMLEVLKVLIPLMVGLFAGWVATRNARKTPHDNLKSLVDIVGKLDDPAQRAVIEVSVAREIRKLDRLNKSREEPFFKWLWIQMTGSEINPLAGLGLGVVLVGAVICLGIYNSKASDGKVEIPYLPAGLSALVLLWLIVAAYVSYRMGKAMADEDDD